MFEILPFSSNHINWSNKRYCPASTALLVYLYHHGFNITAAIFVFIPHIFF